jgi:hypothetical protein
MARVTRLPLASSRHIRRSDKKKSHALQSPCSIQSRALIRILIPVVGISGALPDLRAQARTAPRARVWIDQRRAIEEYPRTVEVVKVEPIGVGVTSPRRAFTAAGERVDSFTWKPIALGRYRGYFREQRKTVELGCG